MLSEIIILDRIASMLKQIIRDDHPGKQALYCLCGGRSGSP